MTPLVAQAARNDLGDRRERLRHAIDTGGPSTDLVRLLDQVDGALDRLGHTSFDECVFCHEHMVEEIERHPMGRYCLCELSSDQVRSLERDLELAWSVQAGLLPSQDLGVPGWSSHYRYLPAGPVSGDVVDIVCDQSGSLHFLLGDVSGKGVSAALLMAHLGATYRSLLGSGLPLDALMAQINSELVKRTDSRRYVTLVAGVARPDGEVELVNAGHVPPLLVGVAGVETIDATGLPAGLFARSQYATRRLHMEPSESLLLYTDGLIESTDSRGNELGVEGLREAAARWPSLDAPGLAAAALSAVAAFRGGRDQCDDETLLVIRRGQNMG